MKISGRFRLALGLALPCLFLACGGGGSQAVTPTVAAPTNVSTAELKGLTLTADITFDLTGTDSHSTTWSGTYVIASKGSQTISLPTATPSSPLTASGTAAATESETTPTSTSTTSTSAYEKETTLTLNTVGTSISSSVSYVTQVYFTSSSDFSTMVKWVNTSNSVTNTAYPTTTPTLGATISKDSTGNWWGFTYTDASTSASKIVSGSWLVTNPGTGNLNWVLTTLSNGSTDRIENWLLDSDGTILSGTLTFYNFAYSGNTTTLTATRQ